MTAQVKTTLGEFTPLLERAIEVSRLEMNYGSNITRVKRSWLTTAEHRVPMSKEDYFELLFSFNPWNSVVGIWSTNALMPKDTEILVDMNVMGHIYVLLQREKK